MIQNRCITNCSVEHSLADLLFHFVITAEETSYSIIHENKFLATFTGYFIYGYTHTTIIYITSYSKSHEYTQTGNMAKQVLKSFLT